ncbi:uncharacterized protein TNIN_106521 [Trichonephila inaurata madagascariensis]|uniref:Uncharacterized protein n=1 Tax=Trichonephila inaurata madagascariensis TaxID=2747483 RepID=A0A8X7C244_9ARAC|nr:uncharacterized protein TNIN_106521 [Trichonephila inaurata madagascariensis]
MEELVSHYEPEWFHLSGFEAVTFIQNYLRELMDTIPIESYSVYLYFVACICHFCVQAIRIERYEIVRYIFQEAVIILYSRCNCYMDFLNLTVAALDYIFSLQPGMKKVRKMGSSTAPED